VTQLDTGSWTERTSRDLYSRRKELPSPFSGSMVRRLHFASCALLTSISVKSKKGKICIHNFSVESSSKVNTRERESKTSENGEAEVADVPVGIVAESIWRQTRARSDASSSWVSGTGGCKQFVEMRRLTKANYAFDL
jgi:hypothetical protein